MSGTVLVTGGCGFIGANLVRRLLQDGRSVRILDNLSAASGEYVDGLDIDLRVGDVLNLSDVIGAAEGCEAVIHLAASTSVLESVTDPARSFTANALGTFQSLEGARRAGVPRFVFASSNAAIGNANPPLTEAIVPQPISPYGASKLAGEAFCSAYHGSFGMGTVALRFANAYGPYSGHKTSVIAKMIGLMRAGEPLPVYGDGEQTRDYIFVEDIARAIALALDVDLNGRCLHIGSGVETTVLELIGKLGQVAGLRPTVRLEPQPAGEIRRNFSGTDTAASVLGFRARIGLEEGLRLTWEWFQQQA